MVAFAKWQYPHTLSLEQKSKKEEIEKNIVPAPEGTNFELRDMLFSALDEKRSHWVDESEDYRKRRMISYT